MKPLRALIVAALAAALSITVVVAAPPASAAVSGNITECANGATVTTCDGGWVTGGLNVGNSEFHEDDVVPQRLVVNGLVPGSTGHTATITYDAKKNGVHGYDYLATYDVTVTGADACQGTSLAALCAAAPSTKDIPSDDLVNVPPSANSLLTSAHELPQADRQMTMFGGTVTAVTKPTHSAPTGASDSATVVVTFSAGSTGDAILVWGTHLAVGTAAVAPHNWGAGFGASNVAGGSLATRVPKVDNVNVGGNNTIQSNAIGAFPPAAFSIKKTASSPTSTPGGAITYTVTVTNTGGQAGATSFTDAADNGVTPTFTGSVPTGGTCTAALVCTTTSLAAGASQVFTFTATMPSSFTGSQTCTGGYLVTNTATITGVTPATAPVCVTAASAFSIKKTASSPTSTPGGSITYTVTVKNTGTAPGATSFTDSADNGVTPVFTSPTVPSGGSCSATNTCTTSSLNPGDSQVFTFTATMPTTFTGPSTCTGGYTVTNTATITGVTPATAPVCVAASPAFTITKTANKSTALPGETVTYTVKVKNTGSAPGSTSFTDDYNDAATAVTPLAAGCVDSTVGTDKKFTCTTSSLAAGDTQTFVYDIKMPTSFTGTPALGCEVVSPGAYPVVNKVTLTGSTTPVPATVCVTAAATFTIDKTPGSATAAAGDTVAYTVVVKNTGTRPGSTTFVDDYPDNATVVLPLPAGCFEANTATNKTISCTTGAIDPGLTQTFVYSLKMPASFSGTPSGCTNGGFPVVNTVVITGQDDDDATVCVTTSPKFDIDKTVTSTTASPGQPVEYTVTVTNNGTGPGATSFTDDFNDDATLVTPLQAGCLDTSTATNEKLTCTTGSINPGTSQTFKYTLTMPATFTGSPSGCANGGYPVVNTVTITGGGATDSVTICVDAKPILTVTKSVSPTKPQPGDTVTYTITVTNTGTAPGSTTVTDDFDNRLTPTVPLGCSSAGGILTCNTGSIPAGGHQDFVYTATIPTAFSGASDCTVDGKPGYDIKNTASIPGSSKTVDVCVPAAPAFRITKTVTPTTGVKPGDTVHYTVTVFNDGAAGGSTGFVDNYDDRVTADLPVSNPAGGTCSRLTAGDDVFSCTTGTIAAHSQQTFTYDAKIPASFTGASGTDGCAPGTFAVTNIATLVTGGADAPATVCVDAKPHFTIAKSASGDALPGSTITYTVTVTNDGTAPGSTSFTDDYDNRLTPTVPSGCTAASGVLTCTTNSIDPGKTQVFTYTATLPATYTGPSGTGGCAPGTYPVLNTATLTSGEHGAPASKTVCVTAAPNVHLVKSVEKTRTAVGDRLTYTLAYSNTGPAEAINATITDAIPDGTSFVSCTGGCSTAGTPAVATWPVASIAPLTGSGSVVLVVDVTSNQACSVTNTAKIQVGSAAAVSSNTVVIDVDPTPDPTGANANGSGNGAQVLTAGLLNLAIGGNGNPIGYSATSQTGPGGPVLDNDSVLSAKVPSNGSLLKVGLVNTSSASAVNGSPIAARQLSTAEVADVCLVPVGGICTVEATALRSVAATLANGTTTGTSSAGSTIANLKVAGLAVADVNENTKITLNPLVFGPGSYVAINERQSTTGLKDGKLFADMTTTAVHLKITGLLKLQSVEIIVAQAKAHSEFLKSKDCNPNNNSVSGHAYVAGANTGPLQTNVIQGFVGMGPKGGGSEQHLLSVAVPANGSLVAAKVADSKTLGTVTATAADSFSVAEVAGEEGAPACVVRTSPTACLVTAVAVRSEARSHADGTTGSVSTSAGTTFVGLKVLGLPVDVNVPPNTVINLPGIGFVVLNEQTCDGGGLAVNGTCAGYPHSGITVRAVHVVVTVLGNVLGLQPAIQVVVAEAHADSTFH